MFGLTYLEDVCVVVLCLRHDGLGRGSAEAGGGWWCIRVEADLLEVVRGKVTDVVRPAAVEADLPPPPPRPKFC